MELAKLVERKLSTTGENWGQLGELREFGGTEMNWDRWGTGWNWVELVENMWQESSSIKNSHRISKSS